MKLRIKGNSLRYRVGRSELAKFVDSGRIEDTIYFASEQAAYREGFKARAAGVIGILDGHDNRNTESVRGRR
jgi:hypothetical protein